MEKHQGRKGGNPYVIEHPGITKENARELQLKGAQKKKENNEKRKALKESLNLLLNKAMKRGELLGVDDIQNIADAEKMNITAQNAMAVALIQRACLGDVQAATFIRDTIGEKPTDKVEVDQTKTIEAWAKTHEIEL